MSATADQSRGTVLDRPDATILDTRTMPWEPFEGFAQGSLVRKILTRFDEGPDAGEPSAFIFYMRPGFSIPDLPYRHYHSTVEELSFALAGELPHWEYENVAQQHGALTIRRQGHAMHRHGGSIHGLEPGPNPLVGYMSLMVRSGTGNWIPDRKFNEETVHVDYDDGWQPDPDTREVQPEPGTGVIVDWSDLLIVDTRLMDWEPVGDALPGGYRKVIASDGAGAPRFNLVFVPPGSPPEPPRAEEEHNCLYVLWGELPLRVDGTRIVLRQGMFSHRRPGSPLTVDTGATTDSGCVALRWRF